jgi:ribosomal protein S18 acetylase RimI-like enzyme
MSQIPYRIRFACVEDLPFLVDIERSAARLFKDTAYSFLANSEPLPLAVLQEWFQEGQIWVAVSQRNILVGFAIVQEVDGTIYLKEIDVDPAYGRQGIGTALVKTICSWAKLQNYSIVSLSTFHHIEWNAPFYEKLGFRILDEAGLSEGFQQIRREEAKAGLPTDQRVIMYRELR